VYVAGTVTATGTNAIVDAVSNGAFVNNMASNVFDSTLAGSLSNKANFVGKSSSEMKTLATYTAMGWTFGGDKPVWKIAASVNNGYPTLVPRPSRGTPSEPTVVEVPATAAPCVAPSNLGVTFRNGSSRLSAKANRQIRSYVSKVKSSNCSRLNLRAYYVKNSPLARQRNQVLAEALRKEFWRQQYVVRIRTSIKATKSRSSLERRVLLSVSK
jgi:hypothetical protein